MPTVNKTVLPHPFQSGCHLFLTVPASTPGSVLNECGESERLCFVLDLWGYYVFNFLILHMMLRSFLLLLRVFISHGY